MKGKLLSILFLLLGLTLKGQDRHLVILHTNDTHSQLESIRTGRDRGFGGVHPRAEYFEKVVSESGRDNVLILDAGDYCQGTPYFTLFKGDMEVEILNSMGYEVLALGNHDLDNGQQELARRIRNSDFTTICANYDFTGTPLEGLIQPYTIVHKAGLKIGLFGLVLNLNTMQASHKLEGMKWLGEYEVAQKMADELRAQGCDLVIALTHIGYGRQGDSREFSDINLAARTTGIDLIIGGHTHTFISKPLVLKNADGKDVTIVQAGGQGVEVGRFDIEWQ
ncbi:MAG: metallophosphoesterase [Bacteroidales bacterium]|nr:metallophosphoesterase [Bacteroidales bacterium]